jgi:hypothetical protein
MISPSHVSVYNLRREELLAESARERLVTHAIHGAADSGAESGRAGGHSGSTDGSVPRLEALTQRRSGNMSSDPAVRRLCRDYRSRCWVALEKSQTHLRNFHDVQRCRGAQNGRTSDIIGGVDRAAADAGRNDLTAAW